MCLFTLHRKPLGRMFCKHDHLFFLILLAQTVMRYSKSSFDNNYKELLSDISLTGTFAIIVYRARIASSRLAPSLSTDDVTNVTVVRTD